MLRLAVGNGVPKMGWQVDVSPQTLGFLLPMGGQQWLLSTVVSGDGWSVATTSGLCALFWKCSGCRSHPTHPCIHPRPPHTTAGGL